MNERKTESIVDELLRQNGFVDIQYQGSEDKNIQALLKSKSGNKAGRRKPEFTMKLNGVASDLVIIECKKDVKYHASANATKQIYTREDIKTLDSKNYAVDSVLHYMESVMGHYNAVGVAVSGTNKSSLDISTFITKNNQIHQVNPKTILRPGDYLKLLKSYEYKFNEEIITQNIQKELLIIHNDLRDKMKLSEQEKPLLVSACLLALQDSTFKSGFKNKTTAQSLAKFMFQTIEDSLLDIMNVPKTKVESMMTHFKFITQNNNVVNNLKFVLEKICYLFDDFAFTETSYDVIGKFYNEFLKYTGGDKKGLGIVLTPKHITDLFCDIVSLNKDSVVLDTCTGTGGFLIAAMKHMIEDAKGDSKKIENIKKNQLIGVEQNTQMFTLACSNMILRHDGQSNIFNDSCFSDDVKYKIRNLKPTVCFINPPYSQKDDTESELAFVNNALGLLEPNGKLVAIVPISSAIEMSQNKIAQRKEIIKNHTLDAVFSMPDELFYPVGTNTCIMVFTAHQPHGVLEVVKNKNGESVEVVKPHKPTYFGYCKDDGFVKTKTLGRCDKFKKYEKIKKEWLKLFRANDAVNGKSAKEYVNERMEWCCEAYMSVDYSSITEADFDKEIRKYLAFQIVNQKKLQKPKI